MCQVDEEEYQQHLERTDRLGVSKKCVKCKELLAAVVVRPGDAYCRSCFKENFIHKFRAMLGKTRVIFPGEKVLLAVSGGPSSCSMLRQVQEGVSQNAHKKLRFLPGIVYIDEGGAVGLSKQERERTTSEVREIFRSTGFPFYILPLEQVLDLPSSVVATAPSLSEPSTASYKAAVDHFLQTGSREDLTTQKQEEKSLPDVSESQTRSLQQLMGSAKSLTAREDLLSTLRQHLLVHTARTEAYSKLMLGDNCTRLAVKLLTSISLGRGAQLAQDTSFSDSRYGDIVSVRPMRDYSAKEIAFYNHMFNVPSVVVPSLETKTPEKSSIQRLTESFITKLQADFPSTVSTIYRTSEKLQTADRSSSAAAAAAAADGGRCLLCMCSLDTVVEKASALQATLISEQLSHMKIQTPGPVEPKATLSAEQCCSSSGEDCGRTGSGCCSSIREMEAADVRSLMCYSCQLTIKDMSSVQHLPQYILSEAQKRKRRSLMKEEIREFLLDADGD